MRSSGSGRLSSYLKETRGANLATTSKVFSNKLVYGILRTFTPSRGIQWVHSRWHWYRFPFSLFGQVLWSRGLQCWFCAQDESALEAMLHLSDYEPVSWFHPVAGDVVLDIGANVGCYAIPSARAVGPSGTVIAMEPEAGTRAQLAKNLSLNGIENVVVLGKAAWSQAGHAGWERNKVPLWNRVVAKSDAAIMETTTVDDVVASLALGRVDWIKLDIEGGEVEALHGARQTLEQFHPKLFVEVHETYAELREWLTGFGYAVAREQFDEAPQKHGWVLMTTGHFRNRLSTEP